MAALIKHVVLFSSGFKVQSRSKSTRKKVWHNPIKPDKKLESVVSGIAARGFLRPLLDFTPPEDVLERCVAICKRNLGNDIDEKTPIMDPKSRFTVLNECFKEFNHSVPNSLLFKINNVGDLTNFYSTPVSTTTPLDQLRTMDLPENLHVQYEPVRFHPVAAAFVMAYRLTGEIHTPSNNVIIRETDTLFGGQTAYPGSSTLVTGLRTKKKYKSYIIPDNYCKE